MRNAIIGNKIRLLVRKMIVVMRARATYGKFDHQIVITRQWIGRLIKIVIQETLVSLVVTGRLLIGGHDVLVRLGIGLSNEYTRVQYATDIDSSRELRVAKQFIDILDSTLQVNFNVK